MMKEILGFGGYTECATGSPRMIIKTAFSAGMIDDEEMWLKALVARNNVFHSYNEKIALSIITDTREIFVDMFAKLKNAVEKDWL